jgi:hypothetical protein|nr:MAG TPA: hypothetical protein [Caudoviricetes sp.]
MIDAKELRIGNYIQLRNNHVMVGGIPNVYKLLIPGEQYAVEVKEFEPIPLTEELFLKCGFRFEYDSFCNGIELSYGISLYNTKDEDKNKLFISVNNAEYAISHIPIKYLHQLQNIYYYLTGKELEVSL